MRNLLTIIGALLLASFTTMAYLHANFMTVREKISIEQRLDRIEKKVDTLILWGRPSQRGK